MSNPENLERPSPPEKAPRKTVDPATARKIGGVALRGANKKG